jgi:general secretion pathway protein N
MARWLKVLGVALLAGGAWVSSGASKAVAATSATLDILPGEEGRAANDSVDVGALKPIARPGREVLGRPVPSGNPLWAVPLSVLTATRDRPIFSASRRPPQPAVVAPPVEAAAPVAQKAAEPEHPPLALIGAVVGDSDAIAVFLDRSSQKIVRLRPGETNSGWTLSSVSPREVTFKKADRTEILALTRPDGSATAPAAPATPGMVMPAAVNGGASFAPFVPHSTPKNGESDGL